MTDFQRNWWDQVRSDHAVLGVLRAAKVEPCHQLHYLRMVTEKLAKAYSWRMGVAPGKSHAGFTEFLRDLGRRGKADRRVIAAALGLSTARALAARVKALTPLAFALEQLAPSLAGDDGPNPEYPWPRLEPVNVPARHAFDVWRDLQEVRGRQLLKLIDLAVENFPDYA